VLRSTGEKKTKTPLRGDGPQNKKGKGCFTGKKKLKPRTPGGVGNRKRLSGGVLKNGIGKTNQSSFYPSVLRILLRKKWGEGH